MLPKSSLVSFPQQTLAPRISHCEHFTERSAWIHIADQEEKIIFKKFLMAERNVRFKMQKPAEILVF